MNTATQQSAYRPPDRGSYDQRITLREPTLSQGDRGGTEMVFEDRATIWAVVRSTRRQGQEDIIANQEVVVTPIEFTIQPRRALREDWRIVWQAEIYEIINIERLAYGRYGPWVIQAQKLSSDNA